MLKIAVLNVFLFVSFFSAFEALAKAPKDEVFRAMKAGDFSKRDYKKLQYGADDDYFAEMDKGVTLPADRLQENGEPFPDNQDVLHKRIEAYAPGMTKEEAVKAVVRGRNNWMVFTGGNDQFWDFFNRSAFGGIDFLKTLSNHPDASTLRSQRWEKLGLVNEPCFKESKAPRADRYGLWLDVRDESCQADPFENTKEYPGVKVGSRGEDLYVNVGELPASLKRGQGNPEGRLKNYLQTKHQDKKVKHPIGSSYGFASGILGLRLFPNPDFGLKEAATWDPERYYKDPSYYKDPDLVKPYRVGMACAFCHVGPSPVNPPKDFNAPKWENLSSNVGAQYFWVDRVFFWNYRKEKNNLVHQLLHTAKPGTLDTSLISSDQINNPRTMNAVYGLGARVKAAAEFSHWEKLEGDENLNKQFTDMKEVNGDSPLANFSVKNGKIKFGKNEQSEKGNYVLSPRVLKDGADSVGALGALNRVYVNIGLYSEEWVRNFVPLLGTLGVPFLNITPFEIKKAEKNSGYWNANVEQTPDLALFFLASSTKDSLKDAPGGESHLKDYNSSIVNRGKEVFAENCASCHSSKLPETAASFFKSASCMGEGYLDCWQKYWNHASTNRTFQKELTEIVKADSFLKDNYLSTELRVPVDVVGSQVCSAVATNAIENDIWDNFSSASYKRLPSVKQVKIYQPSQSGAQYVQRVKDLPGGGRGYLRPPSLVSAWSAAPFFNNNSLGTFEYQGTLDARMKSFNTSMDWLLNPNKRGRTAKRDAGEKVVSYKLNGQTAKGIVDVFSVDTFISLPAAYVPSIIYDNLPSDWKQQYPYDHRINRQSAQLKTKYYTQKDKKKGFFGSIASIFSSKKSKRKLAAYGDEEGYGKGYTGDSADYVLDPDIKENRIFFGPIPKGVPINLISNMNLESGKLDLIKAVLSLKRAIEKVKTVKGEKARAAAFMRIASEPLLKISKCQDFIINKGHYFGTKFQVQGQSGLTVQDQKALTEFIKHM